jgi:hypothetical protein
MSSQGLEGPGAQEECYVLCVDSWLASLMSLEFADCVPPQHKASHFLFELRCSRLREPQNPIQRSWWGLVSCGWVHHAATDFDLRAMWINKQALEDGSGGSHGHVGKGRGGAGTYSPWPQSWSPCNSTFSDIPSMSHPAMTQGVLFRPDYFNGPEHLEKLLLKEYS